MSRNSLQRLYVAILVFSIFAGLPMQGTALAFSATAPIPWAGDDGAFIAGGCNGCGSPPAMSMLCPTVFCVGLTGVVTETPEFGRQPSVAYLRPTPAVSAGLSLTPDPDPPRLFV